MGKVLPKILLALGLSGCAPALRQPFFADRTPRNWVCVYSATASVEDLSRFDLAVLDGENPPDLQQFGTKKPLLFGYLSLVEVGEWHSYRKQVEDCCPLLGKNPNWGGAYIDIREPAWHALVLDNIIPGILARGFDGLFLDTVDTAEYLERYHSKKHPGMLQAATRLIRAIRQRYPEVPLLLNRGFALAGAVADAIDGVVAESVFVVQQDGAPVLNTATALTNTLDLLRSLQRQGLLILTLDYLPEQDARIEDVIRRVRALGFVPYISTQELDRIFTHTLE